MELLFGERCDEVNDKIRLIQKTEGLTFGTDALLLAGYIGEGARSAIELGGGTGIISMLVHTRGKAAHIDCVEVQEAYAELIKRNLALNSLDAHINVIAKDLRELSLSGEYDLVFSNPPYMKTDAGKGNLSDFKNIARREIKGDIFDFCRAASRAVKYGGNCAFVYRADRLCDLISAMREFSIEPKRLTTVHADFSSLPSMVLVEGRRGGGVSLKLTRPFFIYSSPEHTSYSEDMNYVMENGSFPKEFYL